MCEYRHRLTEVGLKQCFGGKRGSSGRVRSEKNVRLQQITAERHSRSLCWRRVANCNTQKARGSSAHDAWLRPVSYSRNVLHLTSSVFQILITLQLLQLIRLLLNRILCQSVHRRAPRATSSHTWTVATLCGRQNWVLWCFFYTFRNKALIDCTCFRKIYFKSES